MTLYGRSTRRATALALGLAGLMGVSAALVIAPPARSAASPFEITLEGTIDEHFVISGPPVTFRSRAPFCATGAFVEDPYVTTDGRRTWRFRCDDGTGSLAVETGTEPGSTWRIVDGSGNYTGLRGRGLFRGELLGDPGSLPVTWRTTLQGVVDRDAVAPTVAFSSATAKKLPRPKGAYALRLRIALRDDVSDNRVWYTVRACAYTVHACAGTALELARKFGTARTEAVSMTLHIRRPAATRTVQLQLTGEDPVGNAVSISRAVRLPR